MRKDPVAQAVTAGYERNDAFQSRWTDDLSRIVKESWVQLEAFIGTLVKRVTSLEERVTVLEKRIADTYTWGANGLALDKPIALPLRVVRDEELVEMTLAAETPSTEGAVQVQLLLDDSPLLTATLEAGQSFVTVPALENEVGPKLTKDQKLTAMTRAPGKGTKGAVVQARCR